MLLNPDLHIDDHWEMAIGKNPRIHSVDHLMTPRNNLEIQTKVISRARAFVGTYGGLSYLAPMYGVTSLAFFSHREKFSSQHLELARRVFGGFKRGSYVVLDTSDIDVLGLAFGERGQLTRRSSARRRCSNDESRADMLRRWLGVPIRRSPRPSRVSRAPGPSAGS